MTLKRAPGFTVLALLMPCLLLCLPAACTTSQPNAAELRRLQGTWEGVEAGQNYSRKIAIRFTGNSLRFQASTNEWHEGDFTLSAGTNPQQLRFTMTGSSTPDHIGQVVFAIFKLEDKTLTLLTRAGTEADAGEPPRSFEDKRSSRYQLRKVQPQKQNAQPPKAK